MMSIKGSEPTLKRWIKRVQQFTGWIFAASVVAYFGWCVHRYVNVGDKEFELFFNAKLAQSLFQCTIALGSIILFDWIYPGRTINAIMDVTRMSAPYDKRTAAFSLLGVGFIALLAVRGGMF